ncbi:MAG: FxsA family protein [Chitinispirillaceae bacterium]|nr:FxsA family protein [Chitinispirillaceae bacterium]
MKLFRTLLLAFTIIPLIELYLIITIGTYIGVWNTIFIVFFTGVLGAWLAHRQGLSVLSRIKSILSMGKMPTDELIDGVMILIAGILLITPGVLTDLTGIFLLIPVFRMKIKLILKKRIRQWISHR